MLINSYKTEDISIDRQHFVITSDTVLQETEETLTDLQQANN
jgi:hypothetical protein